MDFFYVLASGAIGLLVGACFPDELYLRSRAVARIMVM